LRRLKLATSSVICSPDGKDHPLLKDVYGKALKLEKGCLGEQKNWFPLHRSNVPSLREVKRSPRKLYRGFFEEFPNWTPLLLSKNEKEPVMIYKTLRSKHEVGAYVLTTMFIASSWPTSPSTDPPSGLRSLIEGLLINLPDEVRSIHLSPLRGAKVQELSQTSLPPDSSM
jgi:hypothetical protein